MDGAGQEQLRALAIGQRNLMGSVLACAIPGGAEVDRGAADVQACAARDREQRGRQIAPSDPLAFDTAQEINAGLAIAFTRDAVASARAWASPVPRPQVPTTATPARTPTWVPGAATSGLAPSGRARRITVRPSRKRCAMVMASPGRGRKVSSSLVKSRTVSASVARAGRRRGSPASSVTRAAIAPSFSRKILPTALAAAFASRSRFAVFRCAARALQRARPPG